MGCDIHMYVEKKNENGQWELVKGKNRFYGRYDDENEFIYEGWLYDGRNYNLFAILADIRNKYNITPISELRGIPVDSSEELVSEYEYWCGDGHSHSWYSFKELLDFDWENNVVTNEAYVSEEVYKDFKATGNPYPCCGDVAGRDIEKVLNYEMDRIINNKYSWEKDKHFYTAIKWNETYRDNAEGLLEELNEYIQDEKIRNEDLENYRIVFWFDN